jgi:hypothetical protein
MTALWPAHRFLGRLESPKRSLQSSAISASPKTNPATIQTVRRAPA